MSAEVSLKISRKSIYSSNPFFSFLLASWTFELDGGLQKMWIFFAGLFYIVVVMVYSNYNIAKKKDKPPMFAVFKGNINSLV